MDIISILATVILFTTIGTLAVAVAAYVAFKLRDKRRPKKYDPTAHASGPYQPVFLKRYVPGSDATTTADVAAVKE
jgi:heme/copper-type cytochrome/quinol oxidase subunit 2